jgi:hypothetical protein
MNEPKYPDLLCICRLAQFQEQLVYRLKTDGLAPWHNLPISLRIQIRFVKPKLIVSGP